jgi:hypothetical protein
MLLILPAIKPDKFVIKIKLLYIRYVILYGYSRCLDFSGVIMKNTVWVGFGLAVGIGIGWILKIALYKEKSEPVFFKKFAQKGDFALRDTERALSRAEF